MTETTTTPAANAGKRLRRARRSRGMTQGQLAELAACSRATIARLERGSSSPSVGTAQALASVLGVTVEELFGALGDPEAASLFRQVNGDMLAAALLDSEGDDSDLIMWSLPNAALAAQEGMSAAQFASERARALLGLGAALENLRARGWSLDVQTRHDLATQLNGVEMLVTIEALRIPQHDRSK